MVFIMKIKKLIVGSLEENCYIIEKNGKILIVDPGDEYNLISKYIDGNQVVGVLITHNHYDHIGALKDVLRNYNLIKFNEESNDDDFKYIILKTPGHSKDSLSFYFPEENVMFTGDFLFKNSIGRIDLPGGSKNEMIKSLNKIRNYDDAICIYPGHGEKTTLGEEKKNFDFYISVL